MFTLKDGCLSFDGMIITGLSIEQTNSCTLFDSIKAVGLKTLCDNQMCLSTCDFDLYLNYKDVL